MARFSTAGRHVITQNFKERCGKGRCFQRLSRHMRRMEQSHKEWAVLAERGSDLTAEPRRRHAIGAQLHQIGAARDIAARRRNPAAGIFDERARNQICAHTERLFLLDKFPIAIIHHHDYIRFDRLDCLRHSANLRNAQARAQRIAARTLEIDHFGRLINRGTNSRKVRQAALPQLHLTVMDPIIL